MIYVDSCALVKLVREEAESPALRSWFDERAEVPVFTSEIAQAEVARVVRRVHHTDQGRLVDAVELTDDLAEAEDLLSGVRQIGINRELLVKAGALAQPMVRTLDAIHLVSALELAHPDLEFVTYDRRLADAARTAGLRVATPS